MHVGQIGLVAQKLNDPFWPVQRPLGIAQIPLDPCLVTRPTDGQVLQDGQSLVGSPHVRQAVGPVRQQERIIWVQPQGSLILVRRSRMPSEKQVLERELTMGSGIEIIEFNGCVGIDPCLLERLNELLPGEEQATGMFRPRERDVHITNLTTALEDSSEQVARPIRGPERALGHELLRLAKRLLVLGIAKNIPRLGFISLQVQYDRDDAFTRNFPAQPAKVLWGDLNPSGADQLSAGQILKMNDQRYASTSNYASSMNEIFKG